MEKPQETGDEILGQDLSLEWKMRAVRTLTKIFGGGSAHQDPALLRVLTAGVLAVQKLSPDERIYDLGGNIDFRKLAETGATFPFVSGLYTPNPTLIIRGNGATVTIEPDGTVQIKAPARRQTSEQDNSINVSVDKRAYRIGDVLPDGWVVGPRSPKTGIVMAIEPISGALEGYQTWHKGEDHAKELREQGHANARQPSADNNNDELNAIYNEVVKAGRNGNAKFHTSGSFPYSHYWSGTTVLNYRGYARLQYFNGGGRGWNSKGDASAHVRCIDDASDLVETKSGSGVFVYKDDPAPQF